MTPRRRLILLLVVSSSNMPLMEAEVSILLDGFVQRADGSPLGNAQVRLWGFSLEAEAMTDERGHYTLMATTDEPVCTPYAL